MPTIDHFLPIRRTDLHRLLLEGAPEGFHRVADLLTLVLGQESAARVERLKDLYAPLDPNRDTVVATTTGTSDGVAFGAELQALLQRANYRQLSEAELQRAMREESVFRVRLHTELGDFKELIIHTRGPRRRQEVIRSWFGLRNRTLDVEYFERVLLLVRFQGTEHFPEKKRATLPFVPGTMQLKLFANVPAADLEMLFPNSQVRMKAIDQLIIGVPAVLGILGMAAKIGAVLVFLWAVLRWAGHEVGVHHDPGVDPGKLALQAGAVLMAGVAIWMFINRQLMRYRFTKIKFLKSLADNLYFRNLDNHAGAFHRVADEALEEEQKEAIAAYRFLVAGEATAAELDQRIEGWFHERLATRVDFEVDDALAKLERLGLATRHGARWQAVAPTQAIQALGERWRAFGG